MNISEISETKRIPNFLIPIKLLAVVLALLQMGPAAEQSSAYDLSADYSATSNPNGVWSYGAMVTLGGSLSTPFDVHGSVGGDNGVPVDYWVFGAYNPEIWHNGTFDTTISDGGAGVFPPGTVTLFPGGNGVAYAFGVARFTAPQAGHYLLQTAAQTYLDGPKSGDCDYHVLDNGVELFGKNMPGNSATLYTTVVNLGLGDTIDFAVGRGLDGNGNFSGIKLQASLIPVLVPEPASFALLGLGTAALLVSRRRK